MGMIALKNNGGLTPDGGLYMQNIYRNNREKINQN